MYLLKAKFHVLKFCVFQEMDRLLPLLTRLTTEEGLDSQGYQCYKCKSYIGMIYGKPRYDNVFPYF